MTHAGAARSRCIAHVRQLPEPGGASKLAAICISPKTSLLLHRSQLSHKSHQGGRCFGCQVGILLAQTPQCLYIATMPSGMDAGLGLVGRGPDKARDKDLQLAAARLVYQVAAHLTRSDLRHVACAGRRAGRLPCLIPGCDCSHSNQLAARFRSPRAPSRHDPIIMVRITVVAKPVPDTPGLIGGTYLFNAPAEGVTGPALRLEWAQKDLARVNGVCADDVRWFAPAAPTATPVCLNRTDLEAEIAAAAAGDEDSLLLLSSSRSVEVLFSVLPPAARLPVAAAAVAAAAEQSPSPAAATGVGRSARPQRRQQQRQQQQPLQGLADGEQQTIRKLLDRYVARTEEGKISGDSEGSLRRHSWWVLASLATQR